MHYQMPGYWVARVLRCHGVLDHDAKLLGSPKTHIQTGSARVTTPYGVGVGVVSE